jgi:hypothetical protein
MNINDTILDRNGNEYRVVDIQGDTINLFNVSNGESKEVLLSHIIDDTISENLGIDDNVYTLNLDSIKTYEEAMLVLRNLPQVGFMRDGTNESEKLFKYVSKHLKVYVPDEFMGCGGH